MLKNYFTIAFRNLGKNKIYSIINIAGLSVGMTVTMLIGLWVWDELSFNKYHANYDRLARTMMRQTFNDQTGTGRAMSIPTATEIATKYKSDFAHTSLCSWTNTRLLVYNENKLNKTGAYVQPDFPEMLSLKMVAGDRKTAIAEPGTIIVAKSVADALFGKEDPINKTVKVDTKYNYKVTGVFEDIPQSSDFSDIQVLIPWANYLVNEEWVKNAQDQWGNHSFQFYTQLAELANFEKVAKKIMDVEKPHALSKTEQPGVVLHPMAKWHLYSDFKAGVNVGGGIQFVWLFAIIGLFVLFLACINFMNLSTARSEKRAKEVGIRKAIGSFRSQLIGQFLSESFLVVFLAMLLSLLLMLLALPPFNEIAGKHVEFPYQYPLFWIFIVVFSLLTGFISGSYPAFYLSSFNPLKALKGTFKAGKWATLPRKVMVVMQFTVSITLIIGTIIVFQQIQHAKNRPVGYDREGLLQIDMVPNLNGKYFPLRDDLLQSGMVTEMSESSSPTTDIWSNQVGFEWEGKDPTTMPLFGTIGCTHDFGKTIGWKIINGRDFSREFSTDSTAMVMNESGVKLTGIKDIIGKTIRLKDQPKTVVGVVKDMVMDSPYEPAYPTVFLLDYEWANLVNVKLKPGVPVDKALAKVESIFKKYDPDTPFNFKFADQEYDNKFRSEERIGKLARVFAVLAIFISCLGLFGLASFTAEQRTKEIGIRKALGASISQMWVLLSKEFILLVMLSCVIASPIAIYFLSDWLKKYEYHVTLSWVVFIIAALLSIAVTLLTVSFQAIKAALMNPVQSLRSE